MLYFTVAKYYIWMDRLNQKMCPAHKKLIRSDIRRVIEFIETLSLKTHVF